MVLAKTLREASLNRDDELHSKFPGIAGHCVLLLVVCSALFLFLKAKVFPVLPFSLPFQIAFLSTSRFYWGGRFSLGPSLIYLKSA